MGMVARDGSCSSPQVSKNLSGGGYPFGQLSDTNVHQSLATSPASRAVDPHSFLTDTNPAVVFPMRIRIQLEQICKKLPYSFLEKKIAHKYIFTVKIVVKFKFSPILLHFFSCFFK